MAARELAEGLSQEEIELGLRLARALKGSRATSRFAIRTFLAAVDEPEVIGADLSLSYDHRKGHLEAESRIAAPE